jgi:hypothetical protein
VIVGPTPITLPLGWIGENNLIVSMIVIENIEGKKGAGFGSHETTSEVDEGKTAQVVFNGSPCVLTINPGESQILNNPINVDSILLQAVYEGTRLYVTIIPG